MNITLTVVKYYRSVFIHFRIALCVISVAVLLQNNIDVSFLREQQIPLSIMDIYVLYTEL